MSADAAHQLVAAAGRAARTAHSRRSAGPGAIAEALGAMSRRLVERADPALAANAADVEAGGGRSATRCSTACAWTRAAWRMAGQIEALAGRPDSPLAGSRALGDGLVVEERRRPVGVIGANYEARPNVTVDVASQLVKSRNAGVLRTGAAALGSAAALLDEVIGPALATPASTPDAIQLVRTPDRAAARALVSQPGLIPLVILRGSGATTAALAAEAAAHGVRTLAHADGGGVLFVDARGRPRPRPRAGRAQPRPAGRLQPPQPAAPGRAAVGRAGARDARGCSERLGVRPSLPPHDHPLGHEWALDDGHEATVTVAPAADAADAARIANEQTSGIAAAIVTEDPAAAAAFIEAYGGTGAFWNATTRLLDGFELTAAPETGINVDHVPGPRGPVTYRDLHLRQYVVTPAG